MKSKSVKNSLTLMCLMIVLVSVIVIGGISISNISTMTSTANKNYENARLDGYNTEIKSQVQSVIAILQAEYDKSQNGDLTEDEAKKEAAEIVRNMRYRDDGSGYFWIDDTDYNLIMHPILTDQEGNNRYDLTDQNGVKIIQEIMKVSTGSDGGGFNEFYFTKADGVTVAPKIAYSQIFTPWNWVVSTGNYVDDMEAEMNSSKNEVQAKYHTMITVIIIIDLIFTVIVFIASRIFGNTICKPLIEIQNFANRMSTGDLTTGVNVSSKNELGKTAGALDLAQQEVVGLISNIDGVSSHLQSAVSDFKKNFDSMNESIQNVSTAINEIAQNSNSQAASTSSASENIAEIADGIADTSSEMESLDQNAQLMQDRSNKSMETLHRLIDVNSTTKTDIDSMYKMETILKDYDEIVHIPMSSGLSGSCQTAMMLAQEYDNRVFVVDSQRISVTQKYDVIDAKRLADQGKSGQEISDILTENKLNASIYITVNTLDYLKKGGRITPAAALLGGMLKIKPILQIQGEKLDSFAKTRTMARGTKIMKEAITKDIKERFGDDYHNVHICVAYTYDEAPALELKKELEELYPGENIICDPLSLSVSCHIGPHSLAIAICKKI